MTAPHPVKVWDLDKDAESAPRFVVDFRDYDAALSRLRDAVETLQDIASPYADHEWTERAARDCLARIGKVPE